VSVAIRIERGAPGAMIAPAFLGLSYEKNRISAPLLSGGDGRLASLLRALGGGVLRIGGNSVDTTVWDAAGPGGTAGKVAPADIDSMAALQRQTGWRVLYGVNMAAGDPAAAAAEASYAMQAFGPGLLGIEIGNEPDLYHANGIRPRDYGYAAFSGEWQAFARAIHARTPDIVLTGPAAASNVAGWTVPFARDHGGGIALLTQHYYLADGRRPDATVARMLRGDARLDDMLARLQPARRAIAQGFRLAEANSYSHGGAPDVSDAYGSALWLLDFLVLLARSGCSGVNLHGGGNGPGYTPIGDDGRRPVDLRPEYYAMRLFAPLAGTRLLPTAMDAGDAALTAQAAAAADTTLLLVINKNAVRAAHLRVASSGPAEVTRLAAPALDSTDGLQLGGTAIDLDGAWHPLPETAAPAGGVLQLAIPPASAALLRLPNA
jgi:hypothetical protein